MNCYIGIKYLTLDRTLNVKKEHVTSDLNSSKATGHRPIEPVAMFELYFRKAIAPARWTQGFTTSKQYKFQSSVSEKNVTYKRDKKKS